MKIILNQDVYNLGEEGDVCEVANGYARNYLLPQKLAVLFNKQNVSEFESRKTAIEKRKEEKRMASASLKEQIEAVTLELKVTSGDTGKLFGSVSNAQVAEELKNLGINIERKKIEIPEHTIKMLGEYTAKIKLYGNESADLKIIVKSNKVEEEVPAAVKAPKAEVLEESSEPEIAEEEAVAEDTAAAEGEPELENEEVAEESEDESDETEEDDVQ